MLSRFEYEGVSFCKKNMGEIVFTLREFYNCRFIGCQFIETDFTETVFEDCIFEDCNLCLNILDRTKFRKVYFKETKIVGLNFKHCDDFIFEVSFEKCMILRCNFSNLKMKGSSFADSKIQECDFVATDLTEAVFSEADLHDSIFENTILCKTNFENAANYRINPLNNNIAGAKFSMPEVVTLLNVFDISIS